MEHGAHLPVFLDVGISAREKWVSNDLILHRSSCNVHVLYSDVGSLNKPKLEVQPIIVVHSGDDCEFAYRNVENF